MPSAVCLPQILPSMIRPSTVASTSLGATDDGCNRPTSHAAAFWALSANGQQRSGLLPQSRQRVPAR
ncbi:hypothetical protein T440DRAFT_215778 [Plenodomus tracheiphilus IPT5]|uniref:Uncharacterized protein n=1 Tax=Plenodomus tracheiphilus IPT5 TaxID=1408161 RepID=A0A6A7AUT0_9PLEO|nr:hypothetical protein T440DRAFT_215778 [Plenodomus tracheiphilus IPT5]